MSSTTHPAAPSALGGWSISNPVRATLDAMGAVLSLAAAWLLLTWPGTALGRLDALVVLPVTQLLLFSVSGLYHGIAWSPPNKARWQRADHAMIYLKVAGTTTVIALLAADGPRSWCVLLGVWAMAAGGVAQKTWLPDLDHRWSMAAQFAQALLVLLVLGPFMARHPGAPSQLLLVAMLCYLVGFAVFVRERPVLWPGRFCHHDLFHVMLICGALAIYGCVAHCISLA